MERWTGIAILSLSLVGLASVRGAWGLALAAGMWIVGFGLLEHARRPSRV
jgi:hypothetical protein